jgi:hypothetical protein
MLVPGNTTVAAVQIMKKLGCIFNKELPIFIWMEEQLKRSYLSQIQTFARPAYLTPSTITTSYRL